VMNTKGATTPPGGWLGPSVLGLYGLAYVGVALAPCDPGCQAATPSCIIESTC
jgi:hypothetical protein